MCRSVPVARHFEKLRLLMLLHLVLRFAEPLDAGPTTLLLLARYRLCGCAANGAQAHMGVERHRNSCCTGKASLGSVALDSVDWHWTYRPIGLSIKA